MNPAWQEFLASQGARITDGHVHFAEAPATAPCALCDLSHLGLIAAEGADVEQFLQGQLTNDIRELSENHWQLAGFCNAKGRMLANFLLFRRGGTLYLQLPMEHLETILGRLRMFILRAQVTLRDASDELVRMGLCGECAPDLLTQSLGTPPAAPGDVAELDRVTLLRLPGTAPRFEILGEAPRMIALWQSLATKATVVNEDAWALEDIRSGLPVIRPETAEAFVPQMANMQLIDGVSFTKGCYTGQEVVARMQYLGKLKRRMYLGHVDSPTPPAPGAELFSEASRSGQGAGRVVDARPAPEGGYDLLAVLEIAVAEEGEVALGEGGPKVSLKPLPYPFETEQKAEENP